MLWYLGGKAVTNGSESKQVYTRGLSSELALSEVLDYVEIRRKNVIAVSLD